MQQGVYLPGWLLAYTSQKGTIMPQYSQPEPRSFTDLEVSIQRAVSLLEIMADKIAADRENLHDDDHRGDAAVGILFLVGDVSTALRRDFHGCHARYTQMPLAEQNVPNHPEHN